RLASITPVRKGVAIDYQTLNADTNDFTFRSDSTYYVVAPVDFYGPITFECLSVIKFTNNPNAKLEMGEFVSKGAPYRMVIFTSKDDNTVGETISGSTGAPTNYQGASFLTGGVGTYKYMRFSY